MIKNIALVVFCVFFGRFNTFSQESSSQIKLKLKELRAAENFNPESKGHIDLLIELGNVLKYSKTDTVKYLAVESLALSKAIGYDKGKFESLLNHGYFQLFTGKADEAIFYYQTSLDWALSHNFNKLAVKAYNGIGQAHFVKAEYADTFLNFQKSLELAKKINDAKMVIIMTCNLGTLFSILEDYDEALNYYKIARTKFSDNTKIISKVSVLVNLGYLYNKTNEPEKALAYLNESIELLQQVEALKILAFAYLTKGDVYNQTGQYDRALSLFDKADMIYAMTNDQKGEADLYYYAGVSHSKLHNFKSAEEAFLKSLALYKSFQLKSGLAKSYRALYDISKEKGLSSEALSYLELAQQYSDSVGKEKQIRTITMMNAKLSYKKSKAVLAEQNQIKLNKRKTYMVWVTLGLVTSLIISFIIFTVTKTKKNLNKALAKQTSVLATKQEELNKINSSQDKLFSIVGHDLRGPILSLKQLLGTALEKDAEIKNFYAYGPQLKKDVDHIHFTLDNLLNWGLTQMKGDVVKPINIAVKKELLVIEHLFSEALDKKEIALQLLVADTLTITVDPNHFGIIFRNLISNAIKFTPENGTILIDSYVDKNTTYLTVKDTGIGIQEEQIANIYNNREHYTTLGTNNERGTGLGLLLCQELIEKNNGHISVQNEASGGTLVTVGFIKTINKT